MLRQCHGVGAAIILQFTWIFWNSVISYCAPWMLQVKLWHPYSKLRILLQSVVVTEYFVLVCFLWTQKNIITLLKYTISVLVKASSQGYSWSEASDCSNQSERSLQLKWGLFCFAWRVKKTSLPPIGRALCICSTIINLITCQVFFAVNKA